ncbi:hypothetical protein EYF80_068285 [Liparis tanakae]|uniref:Uncharacterized protein n=1 Tax=Liparis tanakae TaxID=230148 RepID=A0A4Z2DYG9_9TELE|nr:hypothetical protein EYF80_068285 [Liparis tanakae]
MVSDEYEQLSSEGEEHIHVTLLRSTARHMGTHQVGSECCFNISNRRTGSYD